jgi:uncharacterized protein YmfQ (DUF2313 family)
MAQNQLLHIFDLGNTFNTDIEIEGDLINNAETSATTLLDEMFIESCTEGSIADWERIYGILPGDSDTLQQRRSSVIAKKLARGRLNREYFETIMEGMGYTIGGAGSQNPHIRFVEGSAYKPFRADVSKADVDCVWDQDEGSNMFTMTIYGTSVVANEKLLLLINYLKVEGIETVFIDE